MKKKRLNLNVVLVEPNGPINVGSIARLCSNFEVNELRIVSPQCDIFSLEARKMALKGQSYIDNCKIFNNIEQAISDCNLVLATCGRIDLSNDIECESPEDISKWISSFVEINNLGILFGREDRGLSNNELLFAHKIINIKTSQNYPSLNLSHAVSIILYELNKSSTNFVEINNLGILFGREDRGLSNNELLFAHKILNIKTSQNYPSLNLSLSLIHI